MTQCKIHPEMFWEFRRKQLKGKSAVTGQELPKTLAECNPQVQADHYAQACYAYANYEIATRPITSWFIAADSLSYVPVPPGVDKDTAAKIRSDALAQMLLDHGVA